MELELSQIVLYVIIPILLSLVGYIRRGDVERIAKIEKRVEKISDESLTATETRQLLADNLDPVSEDLKDIKAKIDKIVDHIIDVQKK